MVTVREFQVQTTQRLTVWKGEITSLPCGLPYPPYRVQWVNESSGKVVANYIDGTFHPPSGGNSRYRMEEDFSLTISEVSVLDEATLTCEVFAYDSKSWRNSTVLTVNARGSHPTFDSCEGAMHCTRVVNSREFQLSCTVRGAKPDVTMSLTATRNSYVMLLPKLFKGRGDGTRDQTIYANVSISSESSSEKFTCSARGEAVQGIANATITVTVKSGAGGLSEVAIVAIIAIPLIVVGLVCFLVFKLTRKKRGDGHKGGRYHFLTSSNAMLSVVTATM
ncbi:uncharacterized protein [Diadema antillarum]|uniref:uncharacterized protein n=1 Tax=Diadema antillarum TaxID=105358 RepID=UPI003A85A556